MKVFFAIVIGITVGASLGYADCRAVHVNRVFHHQAAYVAPVVHHQQYVAAAVYTPYPVYAVGYSYAGNDNVASIYKETVELLKQQNAILLRQQSGLVPQGPAYAPPVKAAAPTYQNNGLAILQSNCASCHTGVKAKGGLALFNDQGQPDESKLNGQVVGEIFGRITTKNPNKVMPPPSSNKALSDSDVRALVSLFVGEPGASAPPSTPQVLVPMQ